VCRGFQSLSVWYFFSGAFGPVKYLLGEAPDVYGAADMTKGMFRKSNVKELSSLAHLVKHLVIIELFIYLFSYQINP
jgi:hypothetical protein